MNLPVSARNPSFCDRLYLGSAQFKPMGSLDLWQVRGSIQLDGEKTKQKAGK